jgi:hypothetical protein
LFRQDLEHFPLLLTLEQIEAFAAYKASYLPEEIAANSAFRRAIGSHAEELLHLAEPEVCAARKRGTNSELAEDEFRERVLYNDGARVAIGGIRFRSDNLRFPFVGINASFDPLEPELVSRVASAARHEFGAFGPKGILISGQPRLAHSSRFERWSHTLCGPATACGSIQLPMQLTCSFPGKVKFYDEYREAYADWRVSSPGLSDFVQVEPREDLEASAAEGLLASFSDNAGWCGVAAGREEALYGMQALYIYEIFLVQRWRGRRAARAMDTALVSKAATRYSLVWEHIHSENWPSLRVALAQRRSVIETEYFFPYQDDGGLHAPRSGATSA